MKEFFYQKNDGQRALIACQETSGLFNIIFIRGCLAKKNKSSLLHQTFEHIAKFSECLKAQGKKTKHSIFRVPIW